MEAHLIDTHLLVPRSRSSAKVKVKYQGHISQKRMFGRISVSQTHLVDIVIPFFRIRIFTESHVPAAKYWHLLVILFSSVLQQDTDNMNCSVHLFAEQYLTL